VKRFTLAATLVVSSLAFSQSPSTPHAGWPGPGQLFVGTCYQPVDRSPEEVHRDIALMKAAGFNMVRMGDLSWDSFEPSEDHFTFDRFDRIVAEMNANGIKVLLDISGLPAPIWLHHKYPSVNVVDQNGITLRPAERYMEDISDPIYRAHILHFADELTRHYAHNPAIIAVGYDNEIGNGFMSYSPGDHARFIVWLKKKYITIDALNQAWQTQRWSRHLNNFDEVDLPYESGPTPSERYLDWHRFWSDETVSVLMDLEHVREKNMPNLPAASNLWDTAGHKGFDYLSSYKNYVTYGAEGYYPGDALHSTIGILLTKGDLPTPTWYNEFITGSGGSYGGPKGIIRMWAYMGLLEYGQTYLAWTFNTHRGGEEQALFGLLDHDGTPSWKYYEFKQIATEFAKLEKLGFPRYHKPDVAIAYSFDSQIASHPSGSNTVKQYFSPSYDDQVAGAYEPFFNDNIDTAFINLAHAKLDYKLVVVPADYIMDAASADNLRAYVHSGGTVIMTAFSAKADEHSNWFDTPLPGRLSDVFGLRTAQFYRNSTPPELTLDGNSIKATNTFYEVLEPHTAQVLASFTNTPDMSPAITVNRYGKGKAIYLATPAQEAVLGPLVRGMYGSLGVERGPVTPSGVYARVVEGRTLYVNTTGDEKSISISGSHRGLISGQNYTTTLTLKPHDADLVQ
jgi:beta-galactosidase